jgi:hypothetical protein
MLSELKHLNINASYGYMTCSALNAQSPRKNEGACSSGFLTEFGDTAEENVNCYLK